MHTKANCHKTKWLWTSCWHSSDCVSITKGSRIKPESVWTHPCTLCMSQVQKLDWMSSVSGGQKEAVCQKAKITTTKNNLFLIRLTSITSRHSVRHSHECCVFLKVTSQRTKCFSFQRNAFHSIIFESRTLGDLHSVASSIVIKNAGSFWKQLHPQD